MYQSHYGVSLHLTAVSLHCYLPNSSFHIFVFTVLHLSLYILGEKDKQPGKYLHFIYLR